MFVPGISVKPLSGLLKFVPREPRRREINKNSIKIVFTNGFLTFPIKNGVKIWSKGGLSQVL